MEIRTLIIAASIIAATAAISVAPISITTANAAPNGDTQTRCVHNGNGADKCGPGSSSTEVTCVKTNGKYVCS